MKKISLLLTPLIAITFLASCGEGQTSVRNVKNFTAVNNEVAVNDDNTFWINQDETPVPEWGGTFRFGLDGTDGNNECIATFPQDIWEIMRDGTFYIDFRPRTPDFFNLRVTTGWWSVAWPNNDGESVPMDDSHLTYNDDGTVTLELTASEVPEFQSILDTQHLLFTGSDYTLLRFYEHKVVRNDIINERKQADAQQNHGYLDINAANATAGEIVTITIYPAEKFRLKEGSLKVSFAPVPPFELDNTEIYNGGSVYRFTMPDCPVIVTAEFEPDHNHVITLVKGKSPTILTPGFKDYYTCEECGEFYEDIEGKILIIDLDAWKNGVGKLDPTLGVGPFAAIIAGVIAGVAVALLIVLLAKQKKKYINGVQLAGNVNTSMFTNIQYRKKQAEDPAFDEYVITFTYQDRTLPYYIFRKKSEHATVEDIKKQFNKVMQSGKLKKYINKVTSKKELY